MNADIINNLLQHQRDNEIKGDKWRVAAYKKAIQQIRSLNYPITNASQLVGMPGIGVKIREKIDLVLQDRPKIPDINPLYSKLLLIHGVGHEKARELIAAGVTSIDDLRGKKHLLNNIQKLGLKYYDTAGKKINRSEMDIHNQFLSLVVQHIQMDAGPVADDLKAEITGSYRRGLQETGDIDVILQSSDPRMFRCFINLLRSLGYIIDTISEGDKMFKGYVKINTTSGSWPRRMDIIYSTPQDYPYALLHFTGPVRFNEQLRMEAKGRGMVLNQYGLWQGPIKVNISKPTECKIMEYLGFRCLQPSQR